MKMLQAEEPQAAPLRLNSIAELTVDLILLKQPRDV